MSIYEFQGADAHYTIIVGWDGFRRSFFAQVKREPQGEEHGAVLLSLGTAEQIETLSAIVDQLAPHGGVPQHIQASLLCDRARDLCQPLGEMQSELTAILSGANRQEGKPVLDPSKTYYILFDAHGCWVRDWNELPAGLEERNARFYAHIYGAPPEAGPLRRVEMARHYLSDFRIVLLTAQGGASSGLPICACLPRRAVALRGAVIACCLGTGLTEDMVRLALDEILFVEPGLRPLVAAVCAGGAGCPGGMPEVIGSAQLPPGPLF